MFHYFKLLSLAVALGLSLLGARPATPAQHISAGYPADISTRSLPAAGTRADGLTRGQWAAIERADEAALAAELAKEQADAEAAAAAAAAAAAPAPVLHFTPSVGSGQVQDLIRQAFGPMGQSAVDWGLRVAACESGYNPNAYNPDGASGVFQFMPGTFAHTPYGGQNIFDATANVNAAAWYFGQHGGGAWSCK